MELPGGVPADDAAVVVGGEVQGVFRGIVQGVVEFHGADPAAGDGILGPEGLGLTLGGVHFGEGFGLAHQVDLLFGFPDFLGRGGENHQTEA